MGENRGSVPASDKPLHVLCGGGDVPDKLNRFPESTQSSI